MPYCLGFARGTVALAVLAVLAVGACSSDSCEDGPFGGATCTYDGEITTGDTLLFRGEAAIYTAIATYGIGPGIPSTIRWGTSDTTMLDVVVLGDLTASVTAVDTGAAWVYALVNEEFRDSVLVTVVLRGDARWRASFPAELVGVYPAIGTDSVIRVVTGGTAAVLRLYAPEGPGSGTTVAGCFSTLGPSLGAGDVAFTTGVQCTRRHAESGDTLWTAPVGTGTLGVAVATDGGAITVTGDSVYRLGATGAIVWGRVLGGTPRTAPVLGPGGDVYVGWTAGGADSVSRFALDGTPRWTVPVPGLSVGTPAATATRLLITRPGGFFALDSSGTVAWDRAFSTSNPAATATSRTSSPVHDDAIVFVQNEEALYSYSIGGAFIWSADTLGYGPTTGTVGAPALLADGTLVVPCRSVAGEREVCAVRQLNGRLAWRSPLGGGAAQGLAVGDDGTVYVTRSLTAGGSELAALWGRVRPSTEGWPSEGGDQQHTRRW